MPDNWELYRKRRFYDFVEHTMVDITEECTIKNKGYADISEIKYSMDRKTSKSCHHRTTKHGARKRK
jgi:hypothetical protein